MANLIMLIRRRWVVVSLLLALFAAPVLSQTQAQALVIRGETQVFIEVLNGIRDDLDNELALQELVLHGDDNVQLIEQKFQQFSPKLVILLGNKAVNLYARFQQQHATQTFPPAIAMAALFIDKFTSKLKNVTAIRYEIPAVTSAVTMRDILQQPMKKIGVIYRAWMSDLIEENRRFCAAEGIELVAVELPNKMRDPSSAIKNALTTLGKQTDAIWVLNDNNLLSQDALVKAWLPQLNAAKLPVIVGIKQFITKIPLGSFAIVPDNYGLGAQAAGMIFEIMDNNWQLQNTHVIQPLSIKKFINAATLERKGIQYQASKLSQVDEVIQ